MTASMYMQLNRHVDVLAKPDVLICGIGCAGVTAARARAKTIAVERWPFAGGNITAGRLQSAELTKAIWPGRGGVVGRAETTLPSAS